MTPFWQAVATCETGGRWDWGRYRRPGEGTTYEGGVGFFRSSFQLWEHALGLRFAHAWQASPAVQVRVARYGLSVGGFWGCLSGPQHQWIWQLPGR